MKVLLVIVLGIALLVFLVPAVIGIIQGHDPGQLGPISVPGGGAAFVVVLALFAVSLGAWLDSRK